MSSFIVSHRTLNNVVNAWFQFAGGDLANPDTDAAGLGDRLARLNSDAVNERYDDQDAPEPFHFRRQTIGSPSLSLAQAFQSVRCLRYQCAQPGTMSTPEFEGLTKLLNRLAREIAETAAERAGTYWD